MKPFSHSSVIAENNIPCLSLLFTWLPNQMVAYERLRVCKEKREIWIFEGFLLHEQNFLVDKNVTRAQPFVRNHLFK